MATPPLQAAPPPIATNEDGTLSVRVAAPLDEQGYLHLSVPPNVVQPQAILAGCYVLARAGSGDPDRGEDWGIYLRRPLFFGGRYHSDEEEQWLFYLPQTDDPGYQWLARQAQGATINLIGPLGNGFQLRTEAQNLLLLVDWRDDPAWLSWLLPLVDPALDRGGKVTLVVQADKPLAAGMLSALPLAVEVRTVQTEPEWQSTLDETIPWADQICAGIAPERYSRLLQTVRAVRFRNEEGFVQVLVKADLLCGVGACLTCVIPLPRGGHTRACVHGPVFDLAQLVA